MKDANTTPKSFLKNWEPEKIAVFAFLALMLLMPLFVFSFLALAVDHVA